MTKPVVVPVDAAGIPFELQIIPRWILWNYEETEQGWTKVPRQPNGRKASSTNSATWSTFDRVMEVYASGKYSGVGVILNGTGLACVDLDDALDSDGQPSPFASSVLADIPGYAEVSPGGHGLHIFLDTPTRGPAVDKNGPIEFYSHSRYIAVTGRVFADRGEHVDGVDISAAIARHAPKARVSAPAQETDEEAAALLSLDNGPLSDWDLERVKDELLDHIDADCSREEWLTVLMALHHQGDGDHDWLEAAIEWSETGGEKFVSEEDVITRWESFQRDDGGVTLRTLIKLVAKEKVKDHIAVFDRYRDRIDMAADRKELEDVIVAEIRDSEELTDIDKQALAKLVQGKLKKTYQVDVPIASIRKLIIPPSAPTVAQGAPIELQSLVWVDALEAFYDTELRVKRSMRSVEMAYNRLFPADANGRRPSAAMELGNNLDVLTVQNTMYWPGKPEIFEWNGLKFVNEYKITDTPDIEFPDTGDGGGRRAIDAAIAHVNWMFNKPSDRQLLWSWLAYVAQNPGQRINWAMVIEGPEGTGKTLIGEMMMAVLGERNVRVIDSSAITGNFSSWAEGSVLKIVEELKMHGHNRYDAANKLKPLLTNDMISVEGKGSNQRMVRNTASYLIFTNHIDAVPLHDGDRRYGVLSVDRTDVEAKLRSAEFREFGRLFRAHPGAILWWLLGYDDWHPAFEAKGRAPMTDAKLEAIEMTRQDPELVVTELLESGGPGIGKSVIASRMLVAEAGRRIRDAGGRPPQTNGWGMILRAKGWKHGGAVRWRGDVTKVWIRPEIGDAAGPGWLRADPNRLRAELDKTMLENAAADFDSDVD